VPDPGKVFMFARSSAIGFYSSLASQLPHVKTGDDGDNSKNSFFDKKNRRQSSGFNHMIYQV